MCLICCATLCRNEGNRRPKGTANPAPPYLGPTVAQAATFPPLGTRGEGGGQPFLGGRGGRGGGFTPPVRWMGGGAQVFRSVWRGWEFGPGVREGNEDMEGN